MKNIKKTLSRPHIITRRYAEFCAAISGLNETFPDQRIETILENMSEEVELCVSRMASIFQDPKSHDYLEIFIKICFCKSSSFT